MNKFGFIIILACNLILSPLLWAQTGNIIESGDQVLDPNSDGFISLTNAGFNADGYDVDEFEIKMFGVPIFGDGEALNDVQSGQPCGVVDIALDTAGFGIYAGYDNNENLIFRFRLAGDKKSVQSYSILIDTDQFIGNSDLNSNAINPGFEIEITLIQKFGVYVYAIDGVDSCPTPLKAYNVDTHQQKSTSSRESCGDPDIFIDFYVPFSDLTDLFGITPDTNLRFAGVTNVSATCALDGSISDIGGVNDQLYDGCFSCAILDLVENQCPVTVSKLCETCAGFPLGATATPVISLPVIVGDLNINGTAEPEAEIFIALYAGTGGLLDRDTTLSDTNGLWQSNDFTLPLNFGDSVIVNAMLPGKCESGLLDAGLSFAIVSPNQPPHITGSIQTIAYVENSPPVIITDDAIITDDNSSITFATVSVINNYVTGEDLLDANPPPGISASFSAIDGILTLTGTASLADYDSALRSVSFENISDTPSLDIRTVSYKVSDGFNLSPPFTKNVLITQLNDPPVIISGTNPVDTIFVTTQEDVPLLICIEAQDIDLDELVIAGVSVKDGNGEVIIDQGLCMLFTPSENFNGDEYLEVVICDDGTPTLCDTVIVKIVVLPVNDSPKIILDGDQTDSLTYRIEESSVLDFCLDAIDIENDNLIVASIIVTSPTASTVEWQNDLCFQYIHEPGFIGIDVVEIIICDDGSPSRCTKVYIEIEVIDINLPPQITTTTADTLYIDVFKNNTVEICLDATDPDNDPLDFGEIIDISGIGGDAILNYACLDYTPPLNFVGVVLLDISVCDNISPPKCDDIILSINVLPFNNPPQVVVDTQPVDTVLFTTEINTPIDLCLEVVDADNDNVTITNAVTDNGEGTFNIDGTLCVGFIPDTDITGVVWGTVTICDDGDPTLCSQTVIGVNVTPVNDPPSILINGADVDTLYFETTRNVEFEFCLEAIDPNNDELSISSIGEIQAGGFYIPGSDELCLGFVPIDNFIGETLHLITICDNGSPEGCDSVYIKVNVLSLNNPPELLFGGISQDTIKVFTLENIPIDVCVESSDIDGDAISLSELSLLAGDGDISSTQTGSIFCVTYNPTFNYFGTTWIRLGVCDSGQPSQCTDVIIQIEVLNQNNAPEVFQNGIVRDTIRFTMPARSILEKCVDAIDQDGDNLSLNVTTPSIEYGVVEVLPGGLCLNYTPDDDFLGMDYFSVTVCDDQDPSLCASVIVEVNVTSDNTPPVIRLDGNEVDTVFIKATEQTLTSILFDVEDSPGDVLEIANITHVKGAGVTDIDLTNYSLSFNYTPDLLSIGEHIVSISVCDDGLPVLCDSIAIVLDVDQGEVFPYQAISPNDDGFNDFWVIRGIEHYPDNTVHIFDRWNNLVFSLEGYNNNDVVWKGEANHGLTKNDLDDGTYYYKLQLGSEGTVLSGMVIIKR